MSTKAKLALIIASALVSCFSASISVAWDQSELASGYTVYDSTEGVLAQFQTAETNLTIDNVKVGLHELQVVAFNEFGQSEPSQTIVTNIPPQVATPTAVQFSGALLSSTLQWSLTLKWTQPDTNAVSFRVVALSESGSPVQEVVTKLKNVQLSRLVIGATNLITIYAKDAYGNESQPSAPITASVIRSTNEVGSIQFTTVVSSAPR